MGAVAAKLAGAAGVIRVVLIGAESTGKTELARRLAAHYGVAWVPEFVRDYAERKGADEPLAFADHAPIARGQIAREDEYAGRGGALLVLDTDLLSTAVYCEHYYGRVPAWIDVAARERRPDLYLLCEIDVPWVHDPQREGAERREEMQQRFRDAIARSGVPVAVVSGDWSARYRAAVAAIDALLARREPA